ncbi:hypothetical protein ACUHGC_02485 [Testudinibacter sp. P27/CKL/0425]
MTLTEQNAKKYLILKKDLEQALGVKINFDEVNQINLKEHLKPYNAMGVFNLWDSMGLLLNCTEKQYTKDRLKDNRYYPTYRALLSAIRNGSLAKSKIIDDAPDEDPNYAEIEADRTELEQWAKHNGYKWELPPYIPFRASISGEQFSENETEEIITTLQAENEALRQRIAELEAQLEAKENQVPTTVNYDDFSIYGHTTEPIKAIFGTVNKFWINVDYSQPDTIVNAGEIEEWIMNNYSVSRNIGTAIQKITRPEQARTIGSKGNNKKG